MNASPDDSARGPGRPAFGPDMVVTGISLPRELLARVDKAAGKGKRSALVVEAIETYLAKEPSDSRPGPPGASR